MAKTKKVHNKKASEKAANLRGATRKAVIAECGLNAWRKRPARFKNKKAVGRKAACRGKIQGD